MDTNFKIFDFHKDTEFDPDDPELILRAQLVVDNIPKGDTLTLAEAKVLIQVFDGMEAEGMDVATFYDDLHTHQTVQVCWADLEPLIPMAARKSHRS